MGCLRYVKEWCLSELELMKKGAFCKKVLNLARRAESIKPRFSDRFNWFIDRVYFKDYEDFNTTPRNINFFCTVWGEHIDLLFSYGIPSLLQNGNIPTLADEGYKMALNIYTSNKDAERINTYHSKLDALKRYINVNIILLDGFKNSKNDILIALIDQIGKCIEENAMMLLTPPDTIFGNRSISNAVRLVEGKGVCLAAAHPRISKESMMSSDMFGQLRKMERSIENDELVDLAFKYGHSALLNSFDNKDENATWAGISIRKISENTYSVVHNLPTVYLANFTVNDLEFFNNTETFNNWDRAWLRTLVKNSRAKFVGSSDLFFCVEITSENDKIASTKCRKNLLNNDKYVTKWSRYLHNYVCNSFYCTWTGRKPGFSD